MEYRITDVFYNENDIGAVLLNFENGEIQEGHEGQIDFRIVERKRENVVVAQTEKLSYKGAVCSHKYYNNFLMTVDRKTKEASLVFLNEARLKPELPETNSDEPEHMEVDNDVSKVSRADFQRKFGSKRDKRIVEQYEKMKMDINVVKKNLEATAERADIKEEDYSLKVNSDSDERYKPPINRDASIVEEVYNLYNIIPKNVLDSMNYTYILEADLTNEDMSSYVKNTLQEIQEAPKIKKKHRVKCQILIYINCLLKFLNCNARYVHRKDNYSTSYSGSASQHILDHFTLASKSARTRPISMRDKSICYILVLAALANDLEVNLEDLSRDLKGGIKKLQEKCRLLSLTPLNSNKSIYGIKLPLPSAVIPSTPKRSK